MNLNVNSKIKSINKARRKVLRVNQSSNRPICPHCHKPMIKMSLQDYDERDWIVVWKCACNMPSNTSIDKNEDELGIELIVWCNALRLDSRPRNIILN